MSAVWMPMVFFALAGAISPGPVNVIASSLGARDGFVRALPHVAGASLSYCAVVLLMGAGMQALLTPALATVAQYTAAAYLLYLAVRIASAPAQAMDALAAPSTRRQAWAGLLQGASVQSLNPKAWLVALSGVSLFVPLDAQHTSRLWLFCAISGIVCFLSVAVWAALGTLIRQWLHDLRYQRLFNRSLALMLALTVLPMLDLV